MSNYIVVANAASGAGKRARHLPFPTWPLQHINDPAFLNEARTYKGVLVAGGDGTVSAVAQVLQEQSIPIGIIPCGTGNDLARELGISLHLKQTPEAIAAYFDQCESVSVQCWNVVMNSQEYFFINYCSLGLDAAVVRTFATARRKVAWAASLFGPIVNRALYVWVGMTLFHRQPSVHGRLTEEISRQKIAARTLVCTNIRHYSGGAMLSRESDCSDALLEIVVLNSLKDYLVLQLSRIWAAGSLHTVGRGREFSIYFKGHNFLQVDGETVPEAAVDEIKIKPAKKVLFYRPRPHER